MIKEIERYLTDTDRWGRPTQLFSDTASYHIRERNKPCVWIDIHKINKDSVEIDVVVGIKHLVKDGFITYKYDSPIGCIIRDKIKRDSKGKQLLTEDEQFEKDNGESYNEYANRVWNSYGEW